jgi:hypothetical protein
MFRGSFYIIFYESFATMSYSNIIISLPGCFASLFYASINGFYIPINRSYAPINNINAPIFHSQGQISNIYPYKCYVKQLTN